MKRCWLLLAPFLLYSLPYELNFVGLRDSALLKSLFDASQLVLLQDRPPASINGIKYRIASDIPTLLQVMRAYGYYDADITSEVKLEPQAAQVYLYFEPGVQYRLSSYEVFHGDCTQRALLPHCAPFTPENLGLKLGTAALSVNIVNAELNLLTQLSQCGYPLARVEKRRVVVDMETKQVEAAACIQEGPLSKFGPSSISGLQTVKPRYVLRRLDWKEGEIYNSLSLEETQKRLLNSGLFSSVLISHEEELDALGELPMKVRLTEAKHRQVSVGVFYATVDGPGATFAWTHRNVRGMGEVVSLHGEFSQRFLSGEVSYKKPDFLGLDQTYRALGAIEREHIYAYIAFRYRFANYFEKKIDARRNFSVGLEAERVLVSNSASDGNYVLMGLPVFGRYNRSDDLLNPTNGYTLTYQATPFQSMLEAHQHFFKQRLTTTFYIPLWKKWVVFASRIQLGSIAGAKRRDVPLPLLFLGGSEDDLRGYRYLTVSPLGPVTPDGADRKPLGGRSAVFVTLETRIRVTESLGFVPFADFGTVTFSELPDFNTKWYKSVGCGLRYFTFFGPLRADIGFPLDRREGIDPPFRIYASIGQTF